MIRCPSRNIQLFSVEFAHSRGILLRDVKPENCAMGMGRLCNIVHMYDFGIAKLYLNPKTGKHIPMREDRIRLGPGTPRYSSANVHFQRGEYILWYDSQNTTYS